MEGDIKMFLKKWIVKVWTPFDRNKIWSSGGLLCTRLWTFGLLERRVIYWLAERVSASKELLCSVELVTLYWGALTQISQQKKTLKIMRIRIMKLFNCYIKHFSAYSVLKEVEVILRWVQVAVPSGLAV
jgi:hypothetical protein